MAVFKFYVIVMLALISGRCKTKHYYHNTAITNHKYIDTAYNYKLNFNEFHCYYRVIYRHRDTLEKAYNSKPNKGNYSLTDVEYLLINKNSNNFMLISYIPVRNRGAKQTYYMDKYLGDYKDSINLFYLNNFYLGNVIDSSLIMAYKDSKQTKYLNYEISKDSILKINSIIYPNSKYSKRIKKEVKDIFNADILTFYKTNMKGVIVKGVNNIDYKVDSVFTICRFKKRYKSYGKGKKNMILFKYQTPVCIKNKRDTFSNFYFREKGNRIVFTLPLL
jgi:hypothetical protein